MPWGRIDDRLAMSVKIRGLADPGAVGDRAIAQRAEATGTWVMVLSWVAGERSDGFVTEDILRLFGRRDAIDRLLRAQFGRAPLLHRQVDGEACPCMEGRVWADGWDFVIHDYLDRNPTRLENDVHRAKARELKDQALKTRVALRDGDRCRYCARACRPSDRRSDEGRTFDHVDPLVAAGEENLVTACRGCNRRKGRRTPEAAGMVLLDVGATEVRPVDAAGAVVGVETDRQPGYGSVTSALTTASTEQFGQVSDRVSAGGSGSGSAPDSDPDSDPDLDPIQIRHRSRSRSGDPPDPDLSQDQGAALPEDLGLISNPTRNSGSPGTGRGGPGTGPGAGHVGPPPPRPASQALSPYSRPAFRNPDHYAGVPGWGLTPQTQDTGRDLGGESEVDVDVGRDEPVPRGGGP